MRLLTGTGFIGYPIQAEHSARVSTRGRMTVASNMHATYLQKRCALFSPGDLPFDNHAGPDAGKSGYRSH